MNPFPGSLFSQIVVVVVIALVLLPRVVKITQEWERAVILRLGRFVRVRGPGVVFLIPFVERALKVDVRVVTHEVPPQEVITRDNVTIKVSAVLYFRVLVDHVQDAVCKVLNYVQATSQISQTTLRSILGQHELDDLLANREKINLALQRVIDEQTEGWGIKVTVVEIKDVELPTPMQRAMARQAEAEREKRAKIIHAEGEFQAAQRLAEAAQVLGINQGAMQLRFLQTLTEISTENSSTVIFPVPVDTIRPFLQQLSPTVASPTISTLLETVQRPSVLTDKEPGSTEQESSS